MLNFRILLVVLVAGVTSVSAAPFTDNFDPLIAELQTRAAALSNSTDKAEQKQFKAIQKIFKTFAKESTSVVTDLKNAKKVLKTLIKAFPTEFVATPVTAGVPPPSVLATLVQEALDAFNGDETALLAAAQTDLDALPDGNCKAKAQTTLDNAAAILAQTPGAPDVNALAAILAQGATAIVQSEGSVAKALACVNKDSGGCALANAFTANAGGTPFVGGNFIVAQWSPAGGGPGSLVVNAQAVDGSLFGLNLGGCECGSALQGLSSFTLGTGMNAVNYGFISGAGTITQYNTHTHAGPVCGFFSGVAAQSGVPTNTISVTGEFTVLTVTVLP